MTSYTVVYLTSDVTMKRLGDVFIDGELDTIEHLSFGHDTYIKIGDQVRRMNCCVICFHLVCSGLNVDTLCM